MCGSPRRPPESLPPIAPSHPGGGRRQPRTRPSSSWCGWRAQRSSSPAVWSSGFRTLLGDNHDTIQLTYLQEHWYQVLLGHASWQSPAIFYPLKGVLGWSDGLLLFDVFYAPLRLLGADMFLAEEITIILLSLVGFVSFVCLARVAFGAQGSSP